MLDSSALVAFVGVADLGVARKFYGEALGLTLGDESPYALVAQAGTATLRITAVEAPAAAPYTVLGWQVSDIIAEVESLTRRGVQFVTYPGMGQDELGVWNAPSGARIAWFLDPDANLLSLTQFAS